MSTPDLMRDAIRSDLERGELVQVLVRVAFPGVVLPSHLGGPLVRIDVCYNFAPPIHDLCVDDNAISGTFSFDRRPCSVVIPWGAVAGIGGGVVPEPSKPKPESKKTITRPAWFRGVFQGEKK